MSDLLEQPIPNWGFTRRLNEAASERFHAGRRFEYQCVPVPAKASIQEARQRDKGVKPVALGVIFSPVQEAQQSPEAIAYEYESYVDCKIMISYHRLAAQGDENEIRKCANDIIFLLKSATKMHGLTRRHNAALKWFAGLNIPRIQEAAQAALRKLYDQIQTVSTEAQVEWLDGRLAVCRFSHPQSDEYGVVEREFELEELPSGIQEGQGFDLVIEIDPDSRRPLDYKASRRRIIEAGKGPEISETPLPDDLDDPVARASYFKARRSAVQSYIQSMAEAFEQPNS